MGVIESYKLSWSYKLLNKKIIVPDFPPETATFFNRDDTPIPDRKNHGFYITPEDLARRELNKQLNKLIREELS